MTTVSDAQSTTSMDTDAAVQSSRRNRRRLIDRLDELAPQFDAEIEGNESAGLLSGRTWDLMRDAEIPMMLMPTSRGGLGMFLRDALEVVEKLAAIDASAGWIGGNWSSVGLFTSMVEAETATRLLGDGPIPYFGVSGAPSGKAVSVDEGFRVTGRWQYGSGDLQAGWVMVNAILCDADGNQLPGPGGMPLIAGFILPGDAIQSHGNWDVLGLRATGSIDFSVADVLVPHDQVVNPFFPPADLPPQLAGGPLSVLPFLHTGFALGACQRLLEEVLAFAQRPSSRGTVLAETPGFRAEYAKQEIAVRSARAFVFESWTDVDAKLAAREPLDRRDFTLLRASMMHMHAVLRGLTAWAFSRGSGTSLRSGSFQRWVRDSMAGCQHLIADEAGYVDIGWELIGAPDNYVWGPVALIELPAMPAE